LRGKGVGKDRKGSVLEGKKGHIGLQLLMDGPGRKRQWKQVGKIGYINSRLHRVRDREKGKNVPKRGRRGKSIGWKIRNIRVIFLNRGWLYRRSRI